jgi:hypothetical protein
LRECGVVVELFPVTSIAAEAGEAIWSAEAGKRNNYMV